jgi:hypothetical protein
MLWLAASRPHGRCSGAVWCWLRLAHVRAPASSGLCGSFGSALWKGEKASDSGRRGRGKPALFICVIVSAAAPFIVLHKIDPENDYIILCQ